jgi:hypothetical protein
MAESELPIVLSGLIGAGGAIAAQVAANIFTGRRERTRLSWEQERQREEWKLRADERFLAQKRDLYTGFNQQADRLLLWVTADFVPPDALRAPLGPPDLAELGRLEANISLIAPIFVSDAVNKAYYELTNAHDCAESEHVSRVRLEEITSDAGDALAEAHRVMRGDLLGTENTLRTAGAASPRL